MSTTVRCASSGSRRAGVIGPFAGALTVGDVPRGQPNPDVTQHPVERLVERSSSVVSRIGVALSAMFVLLPLVGFAAVRLMLASLETWHGGEGDITVEFRVQLLSVALLAIGFVFACAEVLRRSFSRGWIALAVVALGGLACIYIGVRGIIKATGIDGLITALSWVSP